MCCPPDSSPSRLPAVSVRPAQEHTEIPHDPEATRGPIRSMAENGVMSRRSSRPGRGSAPALTDTSPCPCGLPATYGECCGRFHSGEATAPTAELLMRSRYSAFVAHNDAYLLRTWHPSTRPRHLEIDPGMQWTRLEILDTEEGSPFHSSGHGHLPRPLPAPRKARRAARAQPLRAARRRLDVRGRRIPGLSRKRELPGGVRPLWWIRVGRSSAPSPSPTAG